MTEITLQPNLGGEDLEDEEESYDPKTLHKAINLLFDNLSDNDFRVISETESGDLPWLYKNYGSTVARLCGLPDNKALYNSAGLIETTNPDDMIRIVIEAAWKQIHS